MTADAAKTISTLISSYSATTTGSLKAYQRSQKMAKLSTLKLKNMYNMYYNRSFYWKMEPMTPEVWYQVAVNFFEGEETQFEARFWSALLNTPLAPETLVPLHAPLSLAIDMDTQSSFPCHCHDCERGPYVSKQSRDKHFFSKHLKVDNHFPCHLCERSYQHKASLRRHLQIDHGIHSSNRQYSAQP
ncbi:hypothetical protein F5878DRAFT_347289 [Lentinula raphanica]|uniref:C2H2-type domain-containing protein n=1 Tax=Lentinula raphanica TaxID=153919 RepID=A0AA38P200_9AGAR|nr:hypothetical protein F5878DRAFT_347289 [Lentinula raphanica]